MNCKSLIKRANNFFPGLWVILNPMDVIITSFLKQNIYETAYNYAPFLLFLFFSYRQVYNTFGIVTSFTGTYRADEWSLELSSPQSSPNCLSQVCASCELYCNSSAQKHWKRNSIELCRTFGESLPKFRLNFHLAKRKGAA